VIGFRSSQRDAIGNLNLNREKGCKLSTITQFSHNFLMCL
jgi:hypothetical protein